MKKLTKIIITPIFLFLFGITLNACGHSHTYSAEWQSNETQHWLECECGEQSGNAEHIPSGWIMVPASTKYDDGSKYKKCTVCDFVIETDTVPATHVILSANETKELILGEASLASWQGFRAVSERSKPLPQGGNGMVETTYIAQGKTAIDFSLLEEDRHNGEIISGMYIVDAWGYAFRLTDGLGTKQYVSQEIVQDYIDDYYFKNLTVSFLFNDANFENLFKSADKETLEGENFIVTVHVDIEDYTREFMSLIGATGTIPSMEGETIFTFNFDEFGLKSFSLLQIQGKISKHVAFFERLDSNIEKPDWFNEEDYA